jgi:superfamily I DNA and/or RNA helicase
MQTKVNPERGQDERMSVGVITTYGDQAKRIKQIIFPRGRKAYQFISFNERADSKLIISTVDDFQGDERDIIMLSMVRNPKTTGSNPGFINAYQRINVALSRARRLLIIVGNKNYLQKKGVIELPNIDGIKDKDQKQFRIYENIIRTIETNNRGRVFSSTEILPGGDSR